MKSCAYTCIVKCVYDSTYTHTFAFITIVAYFNRIMVIVMKFKLVHFYFNPFRFCSFYLLELKVKSALFDCVLLTI